MTPSDATGHRSAPPTSDREHDEIARPAEREHGETQGTQPLFEAEVGVFAAQRPDGRRPPGRAGRRTPDSRSRRSRTAGSAEPAVCSAPYTTSAVSQHARLAPIRRQNRRSSSVARRPIPETAPDDRPDHEWGAQPRPAEERPLRFGGHRQEVEPRHQREWSPIAAAGTGPGAWPRTTVGLMGRWSRGRGWWTYCSERTLRANDCTLVRRLQQLSCRIA